MSVYKHLIEHEDILTKDNLLHIVKLLSDEVSNKLDSEEKHHLKRKIHCIVSDGHYNKKYAEEDVQHMYYVLNNEKFYGPYYSIEDAEAIYNSLKKSNDILSNYNVYDFYVALNMIKSDNYSLYRRRFSSFNDAKLDELFVEDTLNWLDDLDNPYGTSKVWKYLNK